MDFAATGLPDKPIFRDAFNAGWKKYAQQHTGHADAAPGYYLKGPVAMARLISGHGGECREVAAAACLAGPALFSEAPADGLSKRLLDFSREVCGIDLQAPQDMGGCIASLSGDARLFLQASAVMLLEQIALSNDNMTPKEHAATYRQALQLYSAARGGQDTYKLDTRFEIAAMKVTTFLEKPVHTWALSVPRAGNLVHA